MTQGYCGLRPTKPKEHDTKCPDGFTCYGWRKICQGGYVRFAHERHYAEELKGYAGWYVYVTLADWLGMNVELWLHGPWVNPCVVTEKPEPPRNIMCENCVDQENGCRGVCDLELTL